MSRAKQQSAAPRDLGQTFGQIESQLERYGRFAAYAGLGIGVSVGVFSLLAHWSFLIWAASGFALAGAVGASLVILVLRGHAGLLLRWDSPSVNLRDNALGALAVLWMWIVVAGGVSSLVAFHRPSFSAEITASLGPVARGGAFLAIVLALVFLGLRLSFGKATRKREVSVKVASDQSSEIAVPEFFDESLIRRDLARYISSPNVFYRYVRGVIARFSSVQDVRLLRQLVEEVRARKTLTLEQVRVQREMFEEMHALFLAEAKLKRAPREAELEAKQLDLQHKRLDLEMLASDSVERTRLERDVAALEKEIEDLRRQPGPASVNQAPAITPQSEAEPPVPPEIPVAFRETAARYLAEDDWITKNVPDEKLREELKADLWEAFRQEVPDAVNEIRRMREEYRRATGR